MEERSRSYFALSLDLFDLNLVACDATLSDDWEQIVATGRPLPDDITVEDEAQFLAHLLTFGTEWERETGEL